MQFVGVLDRILVCVLGCVDDFVSYFDFGIVGLYCFDDGLDLVGVNVLYVQIVEFVVCVFGIVVDDLCFLDFGGYIV